MIEEAIVDAYGESEQTTAWFTMLDENLAVPFQTKVLGVPVSVERVDLDEVQMARELGMNPKKLGKLDNHDQEPWKAPLPQFIEHLYFKRFGRERPEVALSIEERAREQRVKKEARKEARRRVRGENDGPPGGPA